MRKKIFILSILLMMILSGCKTDTRQLNEEKYEAYLTYYQAILDYDNKQSQSNEFDISLIINKLSETSYRYDVIIDNPRVAMYNIEVLMIVDDITHAVRTDVMMPSLGILEDETYTMIPYQVDVEKNYVGGLDLSATGTEESVHISVMVQFTNKEKTRVTREYFALADSYTAQSEAQQGEGA